MWLARVFARECMRFAIAKFAIPVHYTAFL
jgi:hypothetical protein